MHTHCVRTFDIPFHMTIMIAVLLLWGAAATRFLSSEDAMIESCRKEQQTLGYEILEESGLRFLFYSTGATGYSGNIFPYSIQHVKTDALVGGYTATGWGVFHQTRMISAGLKQTGSLARSFLFFGDAGYRPTVWNLQTVVYISCECGYAMRSTVPAQSTVDMSDLSAFSCVQLKIGQRTQGTSPSVFANIPIQCARGFQMNTAIIGLRIEYECTRCPAGTWSDPLLPSFQQCRLAECISGKFYEVFKYHEAASCQSCEVVSQQIAFGQGCVKDTYNVSKCMRHSTSVGAEGVDKTCGMDIRSDGLVLGQTNSLYYSCAQIAQTICSDGSNSPFSLVLVNCGVSATTQWQCVPCNTIAKLGHYLHSCANGVADVRPCGSAAASAFNETNYGYKDCGMPSTYASFVGPGKRVACASLEARGPPGMFLHACNSGGLHYLDCIKHGTQCPTYHFQVLCGANMYDTGLKVSLTTRERRSVNLDLAYLQNSYRGHCIDCDAWAPHRCPAPDQVLVACGLQNGSATSVVDASTWFGPLSGQCTTCADLPGGIYCQQSIASSIQTNPNFNFFRQTCNNFGIKHYKTEGKTMVCVACDSLPDCEDGYQRVRCGGVTEGVCTPCDVPDYVGEQIEFIDNDGDACFWRCKAGYTGYNCKTVCNELLSCDAGEELVPCLPPHQAYCRASPWSKPANSMIKLPKLWQHSTHLDFDNFVFYALATGQKMPSTMTVATAAPQNTFAPLSQLMQLNSERWHSNGTVYAHSCSVNNVATDSTHPANPHICNAEDGNAFVSLYVPAMSAVSLRIQLTKPSDVEQSFLHSFWVRALCNKDVAVNVTIHAANATDSCMISVIVPVKQWRLVHKQCPIAVPSRTLLLMYTFFAQQSCSIAVDSVKVLLFFPPFQTVREILTEISDAFGSDKDILIPLGATQFESRSMAAYDMNGDPVMSLLLSNGSMLLQKVSNFMAIQMEIHPIQIWSDPSLKVYTPVASISNPYIPFDIPVEFVHYVGSLQSGLVHIPMLPITPIGNDNSKLVVEVSSATVLFKNIYMVQRPHDMWGCINTHIRYGLQCVSCMRPALSCANPRGFRPDSCNLAEYFAQLQCVPCQSPGPNTQFLVPLGNEECQWICNDGFILSLSASGGQGVSCEPCNTELDCNVGEYKQACLSSVQREGDLTRSVLTLGGGLLLQSDSMLVPQTQSAQSKCVPCTNIARNVRIGAEAAVYIDQSPVYNSNSCPYACLPQYYRSGANCLQCSNQSCYMQKWEPCTATEDMKCVSCDTPPAGTHVVAGSLLPGLPCRVSCLPGFFPCQRCDVRSDEYTRVVFPPTRELLFSDKPPPLTADGLWLLFESPSSRITLKNSQETAFNSGYKNGYPVYAYKVARRGDTVLRMSLEVPASAVSVFFTLQFIPFTTVTSANVYIPTSSMFHTPPSGNKKKLTEMRFWYPNWKEGFLSLTYYFKFEHTPQLEAGTHVLEYICTPDSRGPELFVAITNLTMNYSLVNNMSRCVQCEHSNGLECWQCNNTWHPENSEIITELTDTGYECKWRCLEGFKVNSIETLCLPCLVVQCPVGQYQSDCGTCSNCSMPTEANGLAFFTSAGGAFSSLNQGGAGPLSCAYECVEGTFAVVNASGSQSSAFKSCIPCQSLVSAATDCPANHWIRNCSQTEDASCVPCTEGCPPGFFTGENCSNYKDTTCAACAPGILPLNGTWTSGCDWACVKEGYTKDQFVYRGDKHECMICKPQCPVGQYNSTCDASTAWRGCRDCSLPLGPVIALTSGWHVDACQWRCADGYTDNGKGEQCVPIEAEPVAAPVCSSGSIPCDPGTQPALNRAGTACECSVCPHVLAADTAWLEECHWVCLPPKIRRGDACTTMNIRSRSGSKDPGSTGTVHKITSHVPGVRKIALFVGPVCAGVLVVTLVILCGGRKQLRSKRESVAAGWEERHVAGKEKA